MLNAFNDLSFFMFFMFFVFFVSLCEKFPDFG